MTYRRRIVVSKSSNRPNREEMKQQRKKTKQFEKDFNQKLRDQGLKPSTPGFSISNTISNYQTVEAETEARQEAVTDQAKVIKANLPSLLNRLSAIPDPRNPKKIKHKVTVLLLYGIFTYVFQMSSRRQANRKMTNPIMKQNLMLLFPELETMPHNDTLMRLLAKIDVHEIENAQLDLVKSLIRKKKFKSYLINGRYPIAIDGTQKFTRNYLWSVECLERKIKGKKDEEPKTQYYVYVLEASLAFKNGMTIPLMSEILNYAEGDIATKKQDCELKAFKRLAERLKSKFKNLRLMLLLDGLYPNGPTMRICRDNNWDFMMVLQDKSLSTVWEEYNGLLTLLPENSFKMIWGIKAQHFQWVNDIEYYYDKDKKEIIHVVVCEEEWQKLDKKTGKIINKKSRHAWVSSEPLDENNLHKRCNLAARHRWNIETENRIEKHHGYSYEHCFSYDWNAMKGYHYLMRIGLALNVLAQFSESLIKKIREKGKQEFIEFVRETICASVLNTSWVETYLSGPIQLRLIC